MLRMQPSWEMWLFFVFVFSVSSNAGAGNANNDGKGGETRIRGTFSKDYNSGQSSSSHISYSGQRSFLYSLTPISPTHQSSLSSVTSYDPYYYNSHYSYSNLYNSENETSTALMFNGSTPTPPKEGGPVSKYSLFQTIIIAWIASCLGLLTVLGNILVMVSFKIDKQLQTISNYFLFSLAVADFVIGTIGMPLSTVYLLVGHWPFGPRLCDAWLAIDYLTSNASVLNLLMISFDRYFSVTRPLTYR